MCANVKNLMMKKIQCKVFSVIEAYDNFYHSRLFLASVAMTDEDATNTDL